MRPELELRVRSGPHETADIAVTGEIDLASAPRFRAALAEAAAGHSTIVVDLTAVAYLDSAAVAVLFEQARRGPLEVIVGPGCLVAPVVEVSRLAEVATIRVRRGE